MIQNSSFSILLAHFMGVLYILALFSWGYLTLVLMEVTICKDAKQIDTHKLLHRPVRVRLRMFKRSLRSLFYRSSVGMFLGAFLATMYLMHQLWINEPKHTEWILFHDIFPLSTIYLFHWLGHDVTFFVKLKLFLKGEIS